MNEKEKALYKIHCSNISYLNDTIESIHTEVHGYKIKEGECATRFDDMLYDFIEKARVWKR